MELWVRSQDKDALIKIDNIYAYKEDDTVNLQGDFGFNKSWILGRYKTKERAFKVLDEIQKILEPQLIIKDSGKIIGSFEDTIIREGATYEFKELSTYAYEMPKDEEE